MNPDLDRVPGASSIQTVESDGRDKGFWGEGYEKSKEKGTDQVCLNTFVWRWDVIEAWPLFPNLVLKLHFLHNLITESKLTSLSVLMLFALCFMIFDT